MKILLQILAAAGGSCGFSFLYRLRGLKVLICSLCGASVWSIYLLIVHLTGSDLLGYFVGAFFGTLLSEVLARTMKAPATVFISPSVIPLIPGGTLFHGMEYVVQGAMSIAGPILLHTAAIALLIASGVYAASIVFPYSALMSRRKQKPKTEK